MNQKRARGVEERDNQQEKRKNRNHLQSLLRRNHITNSEYVNVNINKENHIKK